MKSIIYIQGKLINEWKLPTTIELTAITLCEREKRNVAFTEYNRNFNIGYKYECKYKSKDEIYIEDSIGEKKEVLFHSGTGSFPKHEGEYKNDIKK